MANGGLQLWSNCHTTLTWTIDANHAVYIAIPQNGHLARQLTIVQHLPWTLDLHNRRQSCTGHMRSDLGDKSICTSREFPRFPNSAKTLHIYSLNNTAHHKPNCDCWCCNNYQLRLACAKQCISTHIAGIPTIYYLQETITQLIFKQRTVHRKANAFCV